MAGWVGCQTEAEVCVYATAPASAPASGEGTCTYAVPVAPWDSCRLAGDGPSVAAESTGGTPYVAAATVAATDSGSTGSMGAVTSSPVSASSGGDSVGRRSSSSSDGSDLDGGVGGGGYDQCSPKEAAALIAKYLEALELIKGEVSSSQHTCAGLFSVRQSTTRCGL